MRYRKLSPDGDYTFGNGQLDFYRDVPEAVGQLVQTRLLLWLGEWFLDINEGVPYMQGVMGKRGITLANNTIIEQIRGTFGVTDVTNLQSAIDPETRIFTLSCDIDTIYGPTSVQIENRTNY